MGKSVIIIDDALTVRNLAKYALDKAGFKVYEAEDGPEGLKIIKENNIDLILSDVNMPKMNGLDMVRLVKQEIEKKDIPIFMLTTETNPKYVQIGKDLGVTAWIVKPFVPDKLVEAVKKALSK